MSEDMFSVERLERLSKQEGVDTRPILIRVITDLFVQKAQHSPEETARYEELASQLLEVVNVEARVSVARKLADEPRAPLRIIERLIADDVAVSVPILSRFSGVPRQTLLTLALDGGPAEAAAVASRPDVDADMVRLLARHPDDLVIETLAANVAARLNQAALAALVARAVRSPAIAAALLRRPDLDAGALAPIYLHAEPTGRARIRDALSARPARPAFAARSPQGEEAIGLALDEALANAGRGHVIAEAVGDVLGLKPDEAARLVTEPSGEPFVLMLRAAGVGSDLVVRALLLAQPEAAASVPRFFELVEIAECVSRAVAADLVSALIGQAAKSPATRHEPLFDPSGVPERAGSSRIAGKKRRSIGRATDLARNRG